MKISVLGRSGKPDVQDVAYYVESALMESSRHNLIEVSAARVAHNAAEAVGRLVNLLAEKGVLSATEVARVVDRAADNASFVP